MGSLTMEAKGLKIEPNNDGISLMHIPSLSKENKRIILLLEEKGL